jgi:hypothetical protein
MRLILVLALLVTGCSNRYVNGAALAVSTAALAVDWSQTRSMAESGWACCTERNPIMGPEPRTSTVDQYFLGVIAVNAIIWAATPERWRAVAPLGLTAIQARTIVRNSAQTGWLGR